MADQNASAPMTQKGRQSLLDNLRRLKSVERPKIVREIEEAREHGDISENVELFRGLDKTGSLTQF